MISALRQAGSATALRIEWLRVVMMSLLFVSWAMYPVELFIIGHWLDSFESLIPFILTVPGLFFTGWVMFVDRSSTWARTGFIATMWAAIFVGLLGGYSHWVYDMNDVDGVR